MSASGDPIANILGGNPTIGCWLVIDGFGGPPLAAFPQGHEAMARRLAMAEMDRDREAGIEATFVLYGGRRPGCYFDTEEAAIRHTRELAAAKAADEKAPT